MITVQAKQKDWLYTAKSIYREGKSYPEVYRYLIKYLDSDKAISTIYELKKLMENKEAQA